MELILNLSFILHGEGICALEGPHVRGYGDNGATVPKDFILGIEAQ